MTSQFPFGGANYPCLQLDQNLDIATANPAAQQLPLAPGFFRALLTEQELAGLGEGRPVQRLWDRGPDIAVTLLILPQDTGYFALLLPPAAGPDSRSQMLDSMIDALQGLLFTLPGLMHLVSKDEEQGYATVLYTLRKTYGILRTVTDQRWCLYLTQGYTPQLETLDLNEHLATLCRAICDTMPRADLHYAGVEGPVWVQADRTLLDLAVTHLLHNSLSYTTDQNQVQVQLQLLANRAAVYVTDKGLGLQPQVAARAFEAFFSCDPYCDTDIAPGNGLGLFLVRQGVRAMGGECLLESEFGRGTRVSFLLPLAPNGEGAVHCSLADYIADRFSCIYTQFCPLGARMMN